MASVTKRGSKWYAMWRGADGRLVQKVTAARAKAEAMAFAQDKERQAWRQREGLEPDPGEAMTFGELLDWWWDRYGSQRRGYSNDKFLPFLEKHLGELREQELKPGTAGLFADRLDQLLTSKEQDLSPQSLNHLRSAVFNMFERARDPKHRTWSTENPVRWVKRRRIPKASQSSRCVLRRGEVLPTLASFPTPTRDTPWRWLAATCVYAGLRPGEAFGLRKEDVDTRTWTLAVRHSWLAPLPKDGDARDVTIVSELRPLLEAAMKASPSEWVFVHADGTPYTPDVRFHLVDHLRRALKRAGVVEGYRHICRRKGCGFEEIRQVADEARCPKCNMRLWVSPIPRKLRFYDLRHTHATLLRKAGVDLGAVQRNLGHSSPEITAAVYDHSDLEDFRADVDRALTFGEPARVNAPVMQDAEPWKSEGPEAFAFAKNLGAFELSGRLDLNQRPLAPQGPSADFHSGAPGDTATHPVESLAVGGSGGTHTKALGAYGTTPFGAPVARPAEGRFLTPADVAARLQVSRATVYALIERGELVARRVGLALRIHYRELEEFLSGR